MLNTQDFAQKLELILSYYQLTASSFADKIGVQRSSISHLLSGRNKPGLEFVIKIVEFFPEVDLYWFLMDAGSFPKSEIIPIKEEPVKPEEIKCKEPQELISTPRVAATIVEQPKPGKAAASGIDKIVILYEDGSFKSYNPQD